MRTLFAMDLYSPDGLRDAASLISTWRRPLLLTHAKPDGDALGSLVAMRSMLRAKGADPLALVYEEIPGRYALFHGFAPLPIWKEQVAEADLDGVDGVIVLDTCTYNQLTPIEDWLRAARLPKLVIDHHVTRDELADRYVIDESAAATCLMLYDLAKAAAWALDDEACEALFVGIAMDTGWFLHSNTDAPALSAAAELAARGVDPNRFYDSLFLCETPGRVRLLGAALGTLEIHADGRLAVMTLSVDAIRGAGATTADTEDIVNEPLRIGSVVVSVLLVEHSDGVIRASFRSKPPGNVCHRHCADVPDHRPPAPEPRPDIDVAKLAQSFGGGGHARAAGAKIKGKLGEVAIRIVTSIATQLG